MDYRVCPHCKAYNQRGISFCINCGALLPLDKKPEKTEGPIAKPPVATATHEERPASEPSVPNGTETLSPGSVFKLENIVFEASAYMAPTPQPQSEQRTDMSANEPNGKPELTPSAEATTNKAASAKATNPAKEPQVSPMRAEFEPLAGSGFETALSQANDSMRTLYLSIMNYVFNLPYEVSFGPRSHHTTFELVNSKGNVTVFGSVRQPTKTYIALNLKPGDRGFAYGKEGADLAPKEESPNKLFRNVKGVGHWGAGNLEVRLTPKNMPSGTLTDEVQEAIDDAVRAAYGK